MKVVALTLLAVKGIVINIPITSDSFQAFKVGHKIVERDGNIKVLVQWKDFQLVAVTVR